MAITSAAGITLRCVNMAKAASGAGARPDMIVVGAAMVKVANAAAAASKLGGDRRFTKGGFGDPLAASFTVHGDGLGVTVHRDGKSAGPWRVAESGRNQGNGGGMAGPGVSKDGTTRRNKDGSVRKTRKRKARRWNGTTEGWGVWSAAYAAMSPPGMKMITKLHRQRVTKAFLGN